MHYSYIPHGVCSSKIDFEIVNDKIHNIHFTDGCNGNLKAISILCEGKSPTEVVKLLRGVTCDYKNTSCSDQFAQAVEKIINK